MSIDNKRQISIARQLYGDDVAEQVMAALNCGDEHKATRIMHDAEIVSMSKL